MEIILKSKKYGITKVCLIDAEDLQLILKYKWHLQKDKRAKTYYATSTQRCSLTGKQRTVGMHRLILGITDKNVFVDHIDHDGLNNQKSNLRPCSKAENSMHRNGPNRNSAINYIGVYRNRDKFRSNITINGKYTNLGTVATAEEAARLYDAAAKKHFGEFATLNFKEE